MSNRRVIALLVNNAGLRDDYQGALRRGVETACIERDLDLWVYAGRTDFSDSQGAQFRVFDLLSDMRVDGIVVAAGCIAAGNRSVEALIEELRARCRVPICAVGQECPGIPSIVIDNRRGTSELAEHLISHGKRRFVYLGGPRGHQESELRLSGYRDALERHGLTLPEDAVWYGDFMPRSGVQAVRELLASGQPFDALVAANDHMARGARDALLAAGLRCPEDVSVVGFDDARNARVMRPALTTVRQPVARMGALSVARLVAAWAGRGTNRTITLSTDLVVRESCGCHAARPAASEPRASDEGVRQPVRRANAAQLLAGVVDDSAQRKRWARTLCSAIDEPSEGRLPREIGALLSDLTSPFAPLHELYRLLSGLKLLAQSAGTAPLLDAAFDESWSLVSSEAARREAERGLRHEELLEELRIGAEQFATTLTLRDLAAALSTRLPRFGVTTAVISLLSRTTPGTLEPLVVLIDGQPVSVEGGYRAELLLPDAAAHLAERASLTVMPLTFKVEQLGVAVLDLQSGYEVSTLLREQISGAIKSVALYEERLKQQRAQAQAQEERRVTAERLRSLHLIAGGVAHDLNNALGPMLALPDAIAMDLNAHHSGPITSEVFEDLDTIRRASERAGGTHDPRPVGARATASGGRAHARSQSAAQGRSRRAAPAVRRRTGDRSARARQRPAAAGAGHQVALDASALEPGVERDRRDPEPGHDHGEGLRAHAAGDPRRARAGGRRSLRRGRGRGYRRRYPRRAPAARARALLHVAQAPEREGHGTRAHDRAAHREGLRRLPARG